NYFIKEQNLQHELVQLFNKTGDVERLVSKIPLKKINPREIVQLGRSLQAIADIKALCNQSEDEILRNYAHEIVPLEEIANQIKKVLKEDAPAVAAKGGLIHDGLHEGLDELRNIAKNGKTYLLKIQKKEAELTGITSLKIAFNNVFGYYLEVTNAHKDKVPQA